MGYAKLRTSRSTKYEVCFPSLWALRGRLCALRWTVMGLTGGPLGVLRRTCRGLEGWTLRGRKGRRTLSGPKGESPFPHTSRKRPRYIEVAIALLSSFEVLPPQPYGEWPQGPGGGALAKVSATVLDVRQRVSAPCAGAGSARGRPGAHD